MLSMLLSAVVNVLVVLGLGWFVLALLSAKWPFWRGWRRGCATLLGALVLGVARWLWSPEFPREGGGQLAQQRPLLEEDIWA